MKNQITETQLMKNSRMNALRSFREEMKELCYRKMTKEEIRNNNKRLGFRFPDRVTDENHDQEQYIYANRNGYQAVVITSIVNDRFMETGRIWIHITQDDHRLWTRYILKSGYHATFEKVLAYAEFARNVVNNRPQCPKSEAWMDLYEERKTFKFRGQEKVKFVHSWRSGYAEYTFEKYWEFYVKGIPKKRSQFVSKKEYAFNRWFKVRTAKKFARDIRKKVIITKPENSVAKK